MIAMKIQNLKNIKTNRRFYHQVKHLESLGRKKIQLELMFKKQITLQLERKMPSKFKSRRRFKYN